jgi:hypothetical protein
LGGDDHKTGGVQISVAGFGKTLRAASPRHFYPYDSRADERKKY